jgi:hypothetical protein
MILGIILEKKNSGPSAWTHGPLAGLRFTVHGVPQIGTVVGAHLSTARRHSRARGLTATKREARGGDGDLYPGWHKMAEGLRWLSDSGPRWRPEFLDERALEVRR